MAGFGAFSVLRPSLRDRLHAPLAFPRRGKAGRKATRRHRHVALAAPAAEIVTIAVCAMAGRWLYGDEVEITVTLLAAGCIALLFVAAGLLRRDYRAETLLNVGGHAERAISGWLLACALALAIAFMTKTSAVPSRGATGLLVAFGLVGLPLVRIRLATLSRAWAADGRLVVKRLMLVGDAAEIDSFIARHKPEAQGLRLVSAAVLREEAGTFDDDLALAVATARMQRPDVVFVLVPWDDEVMVRTCVDALQRLPAAIHLGPTALLERYAHLRVEQAGPIASVRLVRPALTATDLRLKRAFDLVLASGALVTLAPLLLVVAVAIKLDSRGPVFFMQRRTGYNQQPFRIVKFRSMRTLEDTAALRQVTAGDPRVTRLGRLLRKTSIDELPQLLNVLAGDMSLIGPRPHALAHDQAFGRAHALYERRHNMRPGITGWAQVRGFRGETDTPEKIEGRVRHDLDYVDNWSIWLDLSILLRTVFSPETFKNAR